MTTERHEELAALYAFDLLDGVERRRFESELANSAELRALVDQLRTTAADLSLLTPQVAPPAELRDVILTAAAAPDRRGEVVPFSLARLAPWAAAACLALAAIALGARNASLSAEAESLRTQRELAEVAYKMAQSQLAERTLLAERAIADLGNRLKDTEDLSRLRVTSLASLVNDAPDSRAIAVWDPNQQSGLLTVEKLPAIAAEQDYQIWVIDPQYPIPVDGGVFKPGADGKAVLTFKGDKPVQKVAAFAISLEKKGGVPKAEGPLVLLGKQ